MNPLKLPRGSGEKFHLTCYVAHSLTMKVSSSTALAPFLLILRPLYNLKNLPELELCGRPFLLHLFQISHF